MTATRAPVMPGRSGGFGPILVMLGLLLGPAILWPGDGADPSLRGRVSLALVFAFTGLGHFAKGRDMAELLPPRVPARLPIIWVTGVLELAFAVGLLLPHWSRMTGIAIIAFLILVFPANISAALRRVDFGGHGRGPAYLLLRAPLQLLLIAWAWWFVVR
jgi:uncharacterized membrane protein